MKKQLYGAILCYIVLYIIQFLLIPVISFELVIVDGKLIVLLLSMMIVTFIGVVLFTDKLRHWLLAVLIYAILIFLYSPKGAYNIGVTKMTPDGLIAEYDPSYRYVAILWISLILFCMQAILCVIAKLIRFLWKKRIFIKRQIMKKQLYSPILCYVVLYIIQFLLIPLISFEDTTAEILLFLNTILITIIGVIFFTDKLRYWWLSLFIYTVMILLYSPPEAYGIGLFSFALSSGAPREYDPSVRWVTILAIAFVHFFLQLIICLVAKLVRYLRKRWLA